MLGIDLSSLVAVPILVSTDRKFHQRCRSRLTAQYQYEPLLLSYESRSWFSGQDRVDIVQGQHPHGQAGLNGRAADVRQ